MIEDSMEKNFKGLIDDNAKMTLGEASHLAALREIAAGAFLLEKKAAVVSLLGNVFALFSIVLLVASVLGLIWLFSVV